MLDDRRLRSVGQARSHSKREFQVSSGCCRSPAASVLALTAIKRSFGVRVDSGPNSGSGLHSRRRDPARQIVTLTPASLRRQQTIPTHRRHSSTILITLKAAAFRGSSLAGLTWIDLLTRRWSSARRSRTCRYDRSCRPNRCRPSPWPCRRRVADPDDCSAT